MVAHNGTTDVSTTPLLGVLDPNHHICNQQLSLSLPGASDRRARHITWRAESINSCLTLLPGASDRRARHWTWRAESINSCLSLYTWCEWSASAALNLTSWSMASLPTRASPTKSTRSGAFTEMSFVSARISGSLSCNIHTRGSQRDVVYLADQ